MITLQLTAKQARPVQVAIKQEIIKGSSTFLSGRDVLDLGRVDAELTLELASLNATEKMEVV